MTKKILLALAALTALTLCFSSCKKDDKTQDVKLAVNSEPVTVMVGKTVTLDIKTQPANAGFTCVSKDPSIATVDNKGVVTGVKVGETKVSVTAGTTTKDVAIKVVDMSGVDENRYIGILDKAQDKDGLIAPIYIVELNKIEESKDLIKTANEDKGWVFEEEITMNNGGKLLDYSAPYNKETKEFTDKRKIAEIGYYFFPEGKGNFMILFPKFMFKAEGGNPLADLDNESNKARKDLIFGIATLYGFDANQGTGTLSDGKSPCAFGYNMKQFPEGPYEMLIIASQAKDGSYYLKYQIAQRGPEKTKSSARYQEMMPELVKAPAFKQAVKF